MPHEAWLKKQSVLGWRRPALKGGDERRMRTSFKCLSSRNGSLIFDRRPKKGERNTTNEVKLMESYFSSTQGGNF